MNKPKNKTILILTILSVILCGCPGGFLLISGMVSILSAINQAPSYGDLLINFNSGYLRGGWLVCLSSVLLVVPLVMVILSLTSRRPKTEINPIEPTGASQDDPIPPTR